MQQRAHSVAAKRCCYYGHDARPDSGRAGPPERQGWVGKLDDLMIKVTQVQRCLSRVPECSHSVLAFEVSAEATDQTLTDLS